MADERSVDVDERREPPPETTPRAPIAAGLGQLSPVQSAYGAYTRHAIDCDDCRNVDHTCEIAEGLWRAYQTAGRNAFRRLAGGAT